MSSDLTRYLGNKICRWLGGSAMPTAPASLYVALFDGDPKSGGTEVTTTISASGRKSVTWSVPASNDTDNTLVNSATVDFGAAAGDANVSHFAIFDAATAGKMIASKAVLGGAVAVGAGQPVSFGTGDLSFEIGSA